MTTTKEILKEFKDLLRKAYEQVLAVDEERKGKSLKPGEARGYDFLEGWTTNFIKQALQKQREELIKEAEKELKKEYYSVTNFHWWHIEQALDKLKSNK